MQKKNISHRARSRATDHCTSLPGPFIEKTVPCSRYARAYSPDYVIFIRSKGFTSAKLRNHL